MYLQNDTSTNNDMATILKNDNDDITTTKTNIYTLICDWEQKVFHLVKLTSI